MKEKTLRVLEYGKIVDILEDRTQSSLGKELARTIKPETDLAYIEELQRETEEAVRIIMKEGRPPLYGIYKVKDHVKRAEIGAMLIPESLLKIGDSLRVSRDLKLFLRKIKEDKDLELPLIEDLIGQLEPVKDLEREIERCIISQDEIADAASSKLRSIRTSIRSKNDSIRSKLNGIINSSKYEKYLQDSIVTVREGRFVVPVKQENKRFFPGLVHDQSASGATIFVEPMAVVELNNDLKELEIDEKKEIEEILKRLSSMVAESGYEIRRNQDLLQRLDFIFAKGSLAIEMNGFRPLLNRDRYINIKKGRHPLLDPKKVVPIDLYIGKDFNTLVITGPNTGGKTVSLKTVGLLTLMAQSGLHIPGDSGSEIAVFDQIFADIGDEQSIEQSLSTFSSHMTNIVDILDEVDQNSLVLFDELGAGTDPTEGAALAMSILDNLLGRDIRTLATTHYSQLKLYALTKEGVKNASVEFDVDSLSPTYKLLIGVPGKSNAFEISKRLGLQDYIIDYARNLISDDSQDFEDVLSAIDQDRRTIEEDRYRTEKYREEVETLKAELEREKEKTKESRDKILSSAKEEARDLLRIAKMEADDVLRDLKDISLEIEKDKRRKIHESESRLKKTLKEVEGDLADDLLNVKSKKPPKNLKLGETVEVLSLNQKGRVVEIIDDKNVTVQVGIMKVNLKVDSLRRASEDAKEKTYTSTKKIIKSKMNVKSEIDLRGLSLDEALLELDKYIDDAYIAGLAEAQIIHGKGTGVLKSGIESYLKTNRHVKGQRTGGFSEGGTGVTVISLK